MSRVFIVEQPRRAADLSSAAAFGEVTFIYGPDDRRPSVFQTQMYVASVVGRLRELHFDPATDYFCVAGSMLNAALAMAAAYAYTDDELQLVLWDASAGAYVARSLSTAAIEALIDEVPS